MPGDSYLKKRKRRIKDSFKSERRKKKKRKKAVSNRGFKPLQIILNSRERRRKKVPKYDHLSTLIQAKVIFSDFTENLFIVRLSLIVIAPMTVSPNFV